MLDDIQKIIVIILGSFTIIGTVWAGVKFILPWCCGPKPPSTQHEGATTGTTNQPQSQTITIPLLSINSSDADQLFVKLLSDRQLITYAGAHQKLVGPLPGDKYLPSHTRPVIDQATQSDLRADAWGHPLGLDALIVLKETKLPSSSFFDSNPTITRNQWEAIFGQWILFDDVDALQKTLVSKGYKLDEKEIWVLKSGKQRTPVAITLRGRGKSHRVLFPDGRDANVKVSDLFPLPEVTTE
jgi:hypothetical protein